jgi:hypothetical protein
MVQTNVGLFLVAEKSSILVMAIHKNGTMNLVSNLVVLKKQVLVPM